MQKEHKISLSTAVLININIMLGAGIFINTTELARRTGMLGGFAYLLIGVMMLPLIISIAMLLRIHPGGNFYTFAKEEISPLAGFLSSWGYFTGKLGSATVMIHASGLLLQQLIPAFYQVHILTLDITTLVFFMLLNTLNMKTGARIQALFMQLKLVPILFAIFGGLYLLSGQYFSIQTIRWEGLVGALPLVLYASVGFEAAASISSKMENPQRNAPRAVLYSYGIVMLISVLYQVIFYSVLGDLLEQAYDYRDAFPELAANLMPSLPFTAKKIADLLHIAIASSALGGAYGILFSNTWNMYTLAENGHIFFSKYFTKLNKHAIPVLCVLAEGIIVLTYLFSGAEQVRLQQLGALGCTISYTFSALALLYAKYNRPHIPVPIWVPLLGIINCIVLISTCVYGFFQAGFNTFLAFLILQLIGFIMFFATKKKTTRIG